MTQDEIRTDVNSILDALGFTRAVDEFDFEKQPSQVADKIYGVKLIRVGTLAEIGLGQIEEHRLEVWLSRQSGGLTAIDACRSLSIDRDLVEETLIQSSIDGDRFHVLDESGEQDGPSAVGDCIVGMIAFTVDIDRDLAA